MDSSIMSLAALPPLHLLLSFVMFGVMLHTNGQLQRLLWLPLFLVFSISSLTSAKYFWFIPSLMSLWTQAVTLYVLHIVSVLFIERWPAPMPPSPKAGSVPRVSVQGMGALWAWRLKTTYRLWGNPRLYRVESHAAELDGHSHSDANAKGKQSLCSFLFLRATKLLIYYYLNIYVLPELFAETLVDVMPGDVGRQEQMLFRRFKDFTSREAVIRAYTSISWIWKSLVFLDGANALLAIFFVLVGLDEPQDWPALFGSFGDATNLRRFWSRFWHCLATRPYGNYGRVLAGCVLRLKPETVQFNFFVAFTMFALSGATHAVTAWQFGLQDWHLEICWFLLNFMGCMAERLVLSSIRSLARKTNWSQELIEIENSWLGRLFGCFWVFAFFFWSVPKWQYPRMQQEAIFRQRHRDYMAKLQSFQNA